MITLESELENLEEVYCDINKQFAQFDFCLGGNWEYKYGFLDKFLDQERKVWLRVPFQVTEGQLDGECDRCDALVKLGKPFVFGHLYNEGLEDDASFNVVSAFVSQFQEPVEKDADVDHHWVKQAKHVIQQVEKVILH